MADKKKGFVPIYRSIQDHWIWQTDRPFDERSAWIDLLLMVNHKKDTIFVSGRLQTIKPGQKWTSYCQLAERWRWSRNRVKRFIKLLKSDGMVLTDETTNGTLVTLINYEKFGLRRSTNEPTDEPSDEPSPEPSDESSDEPQTIMNNNVNNDKELKKEKRPPSPGEGYEWNEYLGRWVAPPKNGGVWQ